MRSSHFAVAVARLGAEAFLLDIRVPEASRQTVGFIDHPAHIDEVVWLRLDFVHYVMRGLHRLTGVPATPERRRSLIDKCLAMFSLLQRDLSNLAGSQITLLEQRTLVDYCTAGWLS